MGIRKEPGSSWGVGYRPFLRARILLERMMAQANCMDIEGLKGRLFSGPPRRHKAPGM